MSLTARELLHQERDICDLHAKRLSAALLQDTMGQRVFPWSRLGDRSDQKLWVLDQVLIIPYFYRVLTKYIIYFLYKNLNYGF